MIVLVMVETALEIGLTTVGTKCCQSDDRRIHLSKNWAFGYSKILFTLIIIRKLFNDNYKNTAGF